MAVKVTLSNIVPSTAPDDGWVVGYRVLGTSGSYITPSGSPFTAQPIEFTTADPAGTLYEGFIQNDCGELTSTYFFWQTPCDCAEGYVVSPGGTQCELYETTAPTVSGSGFCLATAQNGAYSNYGMRIYNSTFTNSSVLLPVGSGHSSIAGTSTLAGQWGNPTNSASIGPMNREGVWIDSDCDGTRNALAAGAQTTIAYLYNNPGPTKTIHVGIAADNRFQLVVNGVELVDSVNTSSDLVFKFWHVFPVTVNMGANYINAIATGDGTISDAIAMVVYDNTAAEILAAPSDLSLNIPFHSGQLRGTTYSTATCPSTYSLDTSGGEGNFICRRTTVSICNPSDENPNVAPTANAGSDQTITLPTDTTNLSGAGSSDSDGTISTYLWEKVSGPTGGNITTPNTSTTTITDLEEGVYVFKLTVTDNDGATDEDTVTITVEAANIFPMANAGGDQTIQLPTSGVTLNGSSSSDSDGSITAYLWEKTSGPGAGTITNPASASTTVTGMVAGTYIFRLTVTDNDGATHQDTMQVVVEPANVAPTANAGPNQTIDLPDSDAALTGAASSDSDGTIVGYLWTQLIGPNTATITTPNNVTTNVTGLIEGIYTFQLQVTDNDGATSTDTVQITVDPEAVPEPPVADAGSDQLIFSGSSVLYGSASYDPDGTIVSYAWTHLSGPGGSTISDPTSANTDILDIAVGTHVFQLTVTDNDGLTDTDTVTVEVTSTPPMFRIGYVKSSSQFSLDHSSVQGMTGINTEVWGTRALGEMAVGDVLYTDDTGATPFDGGALAWGFSTVDDGTNDRGVKINLDGTILDLRNYNWSILGYCKAGGICGDEDIDTPIYGATDDPSFYTGKLIYQNTFGSLMASGNYAFAYNSNTPASFTFTVASAWPDTGKFTTGVSCETPLAAPVVYVGLDKSVPLPATSTSLVGSASSDLGDTKTTYQWHKVSGPAGATFTTPTERNTTVNGLVEGTYVFRLVVHDQAGNMGMDDIEVDVFTPLCVSDDLINIEEQMVYDLLGGDESAGNKAIYMFDPSDNTKTSQYVTKYTDFVRWKDADDEDVGRIYIINFQEPYNITKIRANTANCSGGRMHLSFGHKVVEEDMIKRGYDDDPDLTFSLSTGSTDTLLAENLSIKSQYIWLRLHDNDDIRNLRFYGCPATELTPETTFNYTVIPTKNHTMQKVEDLSGFNLLAVLEDPAEKAKWADRGIMRTYDAGTLWNGTNLYQGDKDNVAWTVGGVNTNKFYLNVYDTPYSTRDFNLDMAAQGNKNLLTLRGANGYYRNQLQVSGDTSFNVRSLNQMGDNPRDPESYDRFAWYNGMWAHFFGNNTSSPTTNVRFDDGTYNEPSTPGQGYLKYIAPGNELDGWFFLGRVHSPIEVAAIQTRVYPVVKFYDSTMPVLLQSVVTHNWTFQRTVILCCKIFAQSTALPFDKIEVHATKSTKDFPHIPTTGEMVGMYGSVPEARNVTGSFTGVSEYEKIRMNKEKLWEEMGYEPDIIISEWAYNTNLTRLFPSTDVEVAGTSTIGAPNINAFNRFQSHGIAVLRYFLQIAQSGVYGTNWYEAYDNQPTTGIYYDAPDQSNGLSFSTAAVPGTDETGLKPAYYMWFGLVDKLADYRFDDEPVVAGVGDVWVYRLSHTTITTKKAYIVVYGKEEDEITPPTYSINPPETSTFTIQKWEPSFTSLAGTTSPPDDRTTPLLVNVEVVPDVYLVDLTYP